MRAISSLSCGSIHAGSRRKRAGCVEHEETVWIEIDLHRLADIQIMNAVRQRDPALAGKVEMHKAFRSGDFGDGHQPGHRHRIRSGARQEQMVGTEAEYVRSVGK